MSSKDLANIYESLTSGDSRRKHLRMSDLYGAVINESAIGPGKGVSGKGAPGGMCTHCGGTGIEPQDGWNAKKKNRLVKTWLQKAGFVTQAQMILVAHYMDVAGVEWNTLKEYIAGKRDYKTIKESAASPSGGGFGFDLQNLLTRHNQKFDLKAPIVDEMVMKLHLNAQIADQLYYNLFNMPFQESTVSVGKGELVICLFSAATKGSVGDCMLNDEPATESDDGDETDAPKEQSMSLQANGKQIEVKVGKARVISARGGKFKDPSAAMERAHAARRNKAGAIVHKDKKYNKLAKGERETGASATYEYESDWSHLSNEEYVKQFGGASPAYDAFDSTVRTDPKKSGVGIAEFLNELNIQDPEWSEKNVLASEQKGISPTGAPDYALRERLTNVTIVWSYANPSAEGAHGFDYLLAILSSGVEAKGPGKSAALINRNDPAIPTPYGPEDGDLGPERNEKARGSTGDKAEAFAIDCQGKDGFYNINQAIVDNRLTVQRVNPTSGKIDGEGMYMYFAGSNTQVGHEPDMGLNLTDDL